MIDLNFQQNTRAKVVLVLHDGGDGCMPYAQQVELAIDCHTWEPEVLNEFVEGVAKSMKEHFGYSRPKIFVTSHRGRKTVGEAVI